ncbi:alpha/beta hydrolase [Pantoea sp. Seng]|uniref:alpha/beta hydrolase n=1 Tax=Pantoea sp. Seng TaxID=2576761 RepID=UPI0013235984|nr:alpha/beta hydrolase-fold protein [Pantoea sp. Seng]MXP55384.1 alpha/beta hydrolase [Pantoea sp. Seng]
MLYRFSAINRPIVLLLLLLSSVTTSAFARPNMTPLGPNIADKGSAYYHFSISEYDSADGQRHYKVWTAVPDKAPPPSGYPLITMLDGNAVMDRLTDPLLQKLSADNPPVLVVVGYQTTLPFEVNARTYDYTPLDKEHGDAGYTFSRGRKGGGSSAFRTLLEQRILAAAQKGVHVDHQQRALWGHSYGGLFVLDSYLSSQLFTRYFAASPSIGQGYHSLLGEMQTRKASNKQITLMEGNGDRRSDSNTAEPEVLRAVRTTIEGMAENGAAARYQLYPGLSHGQMFGASMEEALLEMSQAK